jgi:hypothetical protein
MKSIKIIITILFISIFSLVNAQEKQLKKAEEIIQKAVKETDKQKQNELVQKALEIYKDIKQMKEGYKIIGDAFFDAGDLTNAARNYVKCDKEPKKEGYEKVGKAYIDEAFNDPKTEAKVMKKAIDNLSKGVGAGEANRIVGDAYFDKGAEYYDKAMGYYSIGGAAEGIKKIADLYNEDPKTKSKAAEAYSKMKTTEGYKMAGDIHFDKKDYGKAFEYYNLGGVTDGFKKYADAMFDLGKIQEANNMYDRVADTLKQKGNGEELKNMANGAVAKNNYALAGKIFEKLADDKTAGKYKAYDQIMEMNFFDARDNLAKLGITDLSKAIDANQSELSNISQYKMIFDDIQRGVPEVHLVEDPNTKEMVENATEVKAVVEYYTTNKDGIIDNVYKVSESVLKVKHPELKKLLMQRFLKIKAVKNILDNNSFAKKIQKANATAKDVVLF